MIRTVRLLEQTSGSIQREIIIGQPEFLIGRGPDCDLRLSDESTSRHHCMIRIKDDQLEVVDLGSSNGTYVNGERVISQSELDSDDVLRVGTHAFAVRLGDDGEPDPGVTAIDPLRKTVRIPPPK